MRSNGKELDVDFIGGMRPLTKEDERAISEFIKANKIKRAKAQATAGKAKLNRLKSTRSAAKVK
jgi:hypothetical protein